MSTNPIVISDSFPGHELNQLSVPSHYEKYLENILIPKGELKDRIERLSGEIFTDYKGTTIEFVCLLKGAFKFFNDITHNIDVQNNFNNNESVRYAPNFAIASSYKGDHSSGKVEFYMKEIELLEGKDVVIVEDIIDTSVTIPYVVDIFGKQNPKSLKVACLFSKRNPKINSPYKADYVGFSIPDKFIVGYSLDYYQAFRDLSHICVLNKLGEEAFRPKK